MDRSMLCIDQFAATGTLATGAMDRTVCLWDTREGEFFCSFGFHVFSFNLLLSSLLYLSPSILVPLHWHRCARQPARRTKGELREGPDREWGVCHCGKTVPSTVLASVSEVSLGVQRDWSPGFQMHSTAERIRLGDRE